MRTTLAAALASSSIALALASPAQQESDDSNAADETELAWSRGQSGDAQEQLGLPTWGLGFDGTTTQRDGDDNLLIISSPRLTGGAAEFRASMAVAWRDREARLPILDGESGLESMRLGERPDVSASGAKITPPLLDGLFDHPLLSLVEEIYFEGPVEFFENGERSAYAGAVYLDRVDGHGWIADANYTIRERVGGSDYVLKVHADWLRVSTDGSLRSSRATVTTSEFAKPSYVITTGDLQMKPTGDPEFPFDLSMRKNAIQFGSFLRLPLPPINTLVNEKGEPTLGGIRVGDSSRFGTTVGLEYSRDVREAFGDRFNRWLGGEPNSFSSRLNLNLEYYGSRGFLFDPGLRLRSSDRYRWNMDFALVPDRGDDRGVIRVPTDERNDLRLWLRSRGRFNRKPGEWIDLVLTYQSDAAVQSEFFEREYLLFEERESYVDWRRAWDEDFATIEVSWLFDDFRSGVERLPEGRYVHERYPIWNANKFQLLYGWEARAGYLNREQGLAQFLEPEYADGFAEESTLRLDTTHRLEVPLTLGFLGLRATPFTDLRLTGWSDSAGADDPIGRVAGLAGARLATTFWRRGDNGSSQELSPSVTWRSDYLYEDSANQSAIFDEVELVSLEGNFLETALRGRWSLATLPLELDAEVRAVYAVDSPLIQESDWLPISVFGSASTSFGEVGVDVSHDAIYDLDTGDTDYARTLFDIYPRRDLDLQFGFGVGRDESDQSVFEAATFAAVYRFTPKWDLEGRHTIDLDEDLGLATSVKIKRYGHDLLFELNFRQREGEGTSVGIGIKPLLSARKRPTARKRLFED